MERIWDALQFGVACLVGTMLFTLGVREIRRRHLCKCWRFFFHLSLVLVSLGAIFGCNRSGKQPPAPSQTSAVPSSTPSASPFQGAKLDLQDEYDGLRIASTHKAGTKELQACQERLNHSLEVVKRLHETRSLQQEEAQYLSDVFRQLWERAQAVSQGHEEERASSVSRCLRELNAQDQVLMHLNASRYFDPFLARLLKDQVRGSFRALREVPLAERMSGGQISHEEYRELACRVQDNLFLYHQKSVPSVALSRPVAISAVPEDPSRPQCKYGVREPAPHESLALQVAVEDRAVVSAVGPGEMWIKRTGKNWERLTAGSTITTSCVVENRGTKGTSLTQPLHQVPIGAQEIVTGWEFDSASDDLR